MANVTTSTKGEKMVQTIEIDEIQQHLEKIQPGMPVAITSAAAPGDAVRQGDLYLVVVDKVPLDYEEKKGKFVQLVPGQTQGSKHCLDGLCGVRIFLPPKWDEESLEGPCLILSEERTVLHPTHGSVTIAAGLVIQCIYQREYDKELAKERRARD